MTKKQRRKVYRDLKSIGVTCHLPKEMDSAGLMSSTILITGMVWSQTKQGENFWYKVYMELKDNGL